MVLIIALYFIVALSLPAHAYMSMDNSSVMVQAVAGGLGGSLLVLRYLWRRFVAQLRRRET